MYTLAQNTIATANKAILRDLCKQHGIKNYGKLNNNQMRSSVNNKIMQNVLFKQGVQTAAQKTQKMQPTSKPTFNILSGIFGVATVAPKTDAPVTKRTKQRVKNNQWHPKKGGKTYAVWVQMRYYLAVHKLPLKQAKAAVRAWGVQTNQMQNMVNAQIYRFCKYHGLTSK